MAMGVAVSGVVAYLIFTFSVTDNQTLAAEAGTALRRGMYLTPFAYCLFATPLMWLIALAPIGFVIFLSWRIDRMSIGAAQVAFLLFAIAMGASLSTIFLRYMATSIAQVFFVTARLEQIRQRRPRSVATFTRAPTGSRRMCWS